MDFHSLSRRELQAFCKRNKIPANMTNAAMADALKALEIVEGIEEFIQPSQSESAQSSIEGLESSEVSSPYVAPTAGRSTRRRNVLKNDVEAVTSIMTTTRRTTRKTAAKGSNESQVDSMETPAVGAQAGRRKVQMVSACLKMDSQLKECVEEEKKKDALTTPALASRRRRVEETEKKVYSTRRSVRLAVKNVQMVNDVKSDESEISKNELFPNNGEDQEMNLKEGMDECNEMSEITGVETTENMEETYEVVSDQKQGMTIGEMEVVITHEEVKCTDYVQQNEEICDNSETTENMEENYEVVSDQKQGMTIGEMEVVITREEVKCTDYVQQNEEICDYSESPADENMGMPVNANEVQMIEDSDDVCPSEIEATVEKSKELKLEAIDFVEHDSHLESKVNEVEVEVEDEDEDEDEKKMDVEELNVTLNKLTELRLQPEEGKQTESDEMETLQVEESEKTAVEEVAAVKKNFPSKPPSGVEVEEAPLEMGELIPITDNKENMVSGSEGVVMKERIKASAANESVDLNELSLNQLTKMLKQKLQITNKSSKHGDEAIARQALQALPENQ